MMSHLTTHTQLVNATGENLVTWRNHTRKNKDKKAMEEALAKYEDVSKYETESHSRTFRVI